MTKFIIFLSVLLFSCTQNNNIKIDKSKSIAYAKKDTASADLQSVLLTNQHT